MRAYNRNMGDGRKGLRIVLTGVASIFLGAICLYMSAIRLRGTLWGIGKFEGFTTFLGSVMVVMFGLMGLVSLLFGILYLFSLKRQARR